MEAIAEERLRLQPLRETADYLIDTTGITSRAMKKKLDESLGEMGNEEPPIRAEVMSFGFKRGLPRQADLVIDVRFLPNPFYIESMCRHTGLDPDVREFVMEHPVTKEFMKKYGEPDYLKTSVSILDFDNHQLNIATFNIGAKKSWIGLLENDSKYKYYISIENKTFPKKKHVPTEQELKQMKEQEEKNRELKENSF